MPIDKVIVQSSDNLASKEICRASIAALHRGGCRGEKGEMTGGRHAVALCCSSPPARDRTVLGSGTNGKIMAKLRRFATNCFMRGEFGPEFCPVLPADTIAAHR